MTNDEPEPGPHEAEFESVDGLLGEFFALPDRDAAPTPVADDDFGPFRLVAPLGQGGMGQVFLAEQSAPVQRRVALKILRAGLDSHQLIARFAAEQQVLARMNDDHIAKVFDAGCSRLGRPFFVMEYVEGRPITDHCDALLLSLGARLELFLQVCLGVQHAHDNAVLHRDLKPGNVLVAAQAGRFVVKIIDFGLARALDVQPGERASFSRFGAVLGTPDYMSPEQASGSATLTPATDVYSLGVVLYELLVGVRPFPGLAAQSPLVMQQRLAHEEPAAPSVTFAGVGARGDVLARRRGLDAARLVRRLRGDLDWIVLRALRKEPECRYRSALALADDVQAWLAGRPIVARAESRYERLRRWRRRNPGLAIGLTIGCCALLLSAGLFGYALLLQQDLAAVRSAAAEASADPQLLADLIDPDRLVKLPCEAQRTLLEVALQFHRRRITEQRRGAELRAEVAIAHVEIGTALQKLGRPAEAAAALTTGREMLDELLARTTPGPSLLGPRGRAYDGLSSFARDEGRLDEALSLAQTAIRDLRAAAAAEPDSGRPALAVALGNLVGTFYDLGRHAEALAAADEHLALLDEVSLATPGEAPAVVEVLGAHLSRGLALNGVGRWPEARDALARGLAVGGAGGDRDVRWVRVQLRRLLARMHQKIARNQDDADAQQQARLALAEARALAGDFPGSLDYRDEVARSLYFLGELHRHAGQPAAGKPFYMEGLSLGLSLLDGAPGNRRYQATVRSCLIYGGKVRAELGEQAALAAETLALQSRLPTLTFAAGMVFADLARVAANAREATRGAAAGYADQAMELLRRAVPIPADAVQLLVSAPEFAALRQRTDFRALVPAPKDRCDDRESTIAVPAQWLCGQTGDQLGQLVKDGWRITDFECEGGTPPRFAAALVRNEGSYRRNTWWEPDVDAAAVAAICSARAARIADLAVLVELPQPRYAAVFCQRDDVLGWLFMHRETSKGLRLRSQQHQARPVSLSVNDKVTPERLTATFLGNHLWDFRDWRLHIGGAAAVEQAHRDGWRITDLARLADDTLRSVETRATVDGQRLLLGATEAQVRASLAEHGCRVAAFGTYQRAGQRLYDAVLNPNR